MTNITKYVYKEEDRFYFDPENYTDGTDRLTINYEDGDYVKWQWEGKTLFGTLREEGHNIGLFVIVNVQD